MDLQIVPIALNPILPHEAGHAYRISEVLQSDSAIMIKERYKDDSHRVILERGG